MTTTKEARAMLLPCPFCGAATATPWSSEDLAEQVVWQVSCNQCVTDGPTASTEPEAIAAWNRRDPDTPSLTEARREALEEAANVADGFVCGACGMDGKAAAAIRALVPQGGGHG